jgi:hypothetical protein
MSDKRPSQSGIGRKWAVIVLEAIFEADLPEEQYAYRPRRSAHDAIKLYMRRFILAWKKQGWEQKFGARIVNYADDFVILCRRNAAEARERMEAIMAKLKLTVNPQKTRVCRVPKESFEFPPLPSSSSTAICNQALISASIEPDGTWLYWHPSSKETCEAALRGNQETLSARAR